ncbi:leucine-rich repeat domain-containing protein [Paenibacillus sp. DCT19]|uniref:leucine-rich repeat domain-containing protein n=1 Tax=Paenibacillus sp. DCT19 TaxID=2211212 RepID=UPI000FE1E547|nr:leucine-rich repeat domain-containing protein [Paenibacillus sp. DCT19]
MDITKAFTDEPFREYILEHFCDQRGYIQESDVSEVRTLNVSQIAASNLQGIEYFVELQELDCAYNQLISLDLSHNHKLNRLDCRENQLLALDLRANTALEVLNVSFNRLRKLDLSHNHKLVAIECHWNMLSNLDLQDLQQLKELGCGYNALFSLELAHNKQLERVDCAHNYMLELDLATCPNLVELRCNHNHIKKLNLRSNLLLESVRCFNNHIDELDISQNERLVELYCSDNKLKQLDNRHNPKLERLQYADNLIVEKNHEIHGMGVFQYDASMTNYRMPVLIQENELVVTVQVSTQAEMEDLSTYIEEVWRQWDLLCARALEMIAEAHPDEDVSELVLADAEFQPDRYFRLGYDAGDTPAGQLYIYVEFNGDLEVANDLVYETY